jgi:hypothetical protein
LVGAPWKYTRMPANLVPPDLKAQDEVVRERLEPPFRLDPVTALTSEVLESPRVATYHLLFF